MVSKPLLSDFVGPLRRPGDRAEWVSAPPCSIWRQGTAGVIAFVVLAELIGLSIPQTVLPHMSTVLARTVGLAGNGRFIADVGATLQAWAIGLLVGVNLLVTGFTRLMIGAKGRSLINRVTA